MTTTVIRLAVHGAAGRVGALVSRLARADSRFDVVAEIDLEQGDDVSSGSLATSVPVELVIDFSSDAGARSAASLAEKHAAALVVGTTGLSPQTLDSLDVAARAVPVLVAANMSVGVAVLADLVARAARLLGPGYDVSLIEQHHVHKLDAPSGTALHLADALRREGGVELRPDQIHAVRGGDVVGEHTVEFAGPGERIRLAHLATSRDLFARGALRAAAWLVGQQPGRYTIEQALTGT